MGKPTGRPKGSDKIDTHGPAVLEALALGCSVAEACKQAGIGVATFYRWQSDNESFRDGIKEARDRFSIECDEDLRAKVNLRLMAFLVDGAVARKVIRKYERDDSGNLRLTEKREIEYHNPTPRWVLDKFLPPDLIGDLADLLREGDTKPGDVGINLHLHQGDSDE